ncbi:hypothetical protein D9M71_491600 [compost metagenome]
MANGSISAQSSQRRPGNSQRLVSQARLTPSTVTPIPTPTTSVKVLPSRRVIWVSSRCDQICRSIDCHDSSRTLRGRSTRAAIRETGRYQRRCGAWDKEEVSIAMATAVRSFAGAPTGSAWVHRRRGRKGPRRIKPDA